MEFTEVVRRRKMIHVFEQRPVDATLVDSLLDIARRAPSAGFSQGTDFLVLDEPEALARFWSATEDPRWPNDPDDIAANAPPVLVLALADPGRYVARYSAPDKLAFGLDRAEAWPVPFWDTDTAMACMLLLLALVDAGLGGWFFGVGHGEAEVRAAFGIPDDRNLIGVVGLGYPGVDDAPKGSAHSLSRRPLADMIHRNGW
jgi:nitroreductase